jgi:hypothetical protein
MQVFAQLGNLARKFQRNEPRSNTLIKRVTWGQQMISRATIAIAAALLGSVNTSALAQYENPVDDYSYQLGILGAFSEVVKLGVKTLALGEVMSPEEMDNIIHDAKVVAERNGVELYRETDFLVTDLYPQDIAEGKHVLLIYTNDTLDKYLEIKSDKARLVAEGNYNGTPREDIARRFGRLLSYPAAVIDDLIMKQTMTK